MDTCIGLPEPTERDKGRKFTVSRKVGPIATGGGQILAGSTGVGTCVGFTRAKLKRARLIRPQCHNTILVAHNDHLRILSSYTRQVFGGGGWRVVILDFDKSNDP
jgi:hypothetical protein